VAREYSWAEGWGLADVPLAGLPEITVEQVKVVLDVASRAMREAGWEYEVETRVGAVVDGPVFDIEDQAVFDTLDHGSVCGVEALEALCGIDGPGVRLSASWLEGGKAVNKSRCIARLNAGDERLQIWESAACVLHRPVALDMNRKIARLGERLAGVMGSVAEGGAGEAGGGVSRLDALLAAVPVERRLFQESRVEDGGAGEVVPGDVGPGFDLAHDALALGMGRAVFDENARFVAQWGKWLLWDGLRWVMDTRRMHMTLTRDYLRGRAEEVVAWAEEAAALEEDGREAEKLRAWAKKESRALRSAATIAAVAQLAQSNPGSVASGEDFDTRLMLVGTPEGVLDLEVGAVRDARREDMITRMTGWAPRPGKAVRWLAFLDEVFEGDQEVISFMQRAAGYALTGRVDEHKMLFLYGGGRNGKGVFLNTLTALWGDYVEKAPAESFLTSTTTQHPTNIAKMKGARLVVGAELPKGKVWDEGVIKDLTGGDTMTARFMRQDYFDFVPQLTLMIAGNNQPSFRGVDEAIRSRVVMVPFTVTIPPERRDTGLKERLLAEEGGQIMAWVVEGALEWQRRGLDVPEVIRAASQAYFDGEDVIGQFMGDTMVADAAGFETTTDLYDRFKSWCDGHGLSPWTMHTFRKELVCRGLAAHRSNQGKGFRGYWLKSRRRAVELVDPGGGEKANES
jgi:putative DNA primase/helicase